MVTIIPQNPKLWRPSPPTSSSLLFTVKKFHPKISNTLNNNDETKQSSAGKIKREVLTKEGRTKLNIYSDRDFYAYPRFVTHVDDGFISTLTNLYRQRLRPDSEILDLMSSWVSHLPQEVVFERVVGHGLNAQELAKNPRLDYFIVKDLNQEQKLEFEDCSFDAVLCTVSVQYLQQPEKVIGVCYICIFLKITHRKSFLCIDNYTGIWGSVSGAKTGRSVHSELQQSNVL